MKPVRITVICDVHGCLAPTPLRCDHSRKHGQLPMAMPWAAAHGIAIVYRPWPARLATGGTQSRARGTLPQRSHELEDTGWHSSAHHAVGVEVCHDA